MPLDPVCAAFLEQGRGQPAAETLPVVEARARMEAMVAPLKLLAPPPEVVVEAADADGVPVRIYRPGGAGPHPALLFIHGGGWVVCSLDTHDPLCRHLCVAAGAVVVSVDYRLSPEHVFPAASDDCLTALNWLAANAEALGIDPARIVVAGDSAGGNLAAATAIRARDAGGPKLAGQLLVYPVTDRPGRHPSYAENDNDYGLTTAGMAAYWAHYGAPEGDPLAEPLRADLHGLPPAFVLTAEYDVLRDEGEAYAAALTAAGVAVEAKRYPGMIHGFFSFQGLVPGAAGALADAAAWLRRLWG
jgi:acetyl esterase